VSEALSPAVRRSALWRDRRFGTYWLAQGVSQLGDRVSELALPLIAITALHASSTEVGLLTAVIWLPNLLSLVVGAWVDHQQHKRRLLVVANLLQAVTILTVPAAHYLGVLRLPQLYVVALLVGAGAVLYQSAYPAFFVALVRRDQYVEANSLLSGTRSASYIAGPAAGGGLIQLLTAPVAVIVDGVSFLVSALMIHRVEVSEPKPEAAPAGEGLLTRSRLGMRFVLRHCHLASALRCVAWLNFFNFVAGAVVILFASRNLGLSAGSIGLALGVGASGGLVGAVVAGRAARLLGTGRTIALGVIAFSAPLAFIPLATGPTWAKCAVLAGVEFVSGLGVMLLDVNLNAVMTMVIPDPMRSRVSGAFTSINYGVRPLGAVVGGLLGGLIGVGPTLVVGGVGGALAVVWLLGTPLIRTRGLADLESP
jgi:MFS family permease